MRAGFENNNCSTPFEDAYIAQNPEGSLRTLPTPPAERPRALALTFHRHNSREKGPGEHMNEKNKGQAQKVTICLFEHVPDLRTTCYFWTTPCDLTYVHCLQLAAPCHNPCHTEHAGRVCMEITAAWAEQSRAMTKSRPFSNR